MKKEEIMIGKKYLVSDPGAVFDRFKEKVFELGGDLSKWVDGALPCEDQLVTVLNYHHNYDEFYILIGTENQQFIIGLRGLKEYVPKINALSKYAKKACQVLDDEIKKFVNKGLFQTDFQVGDILIGKFTGREYKLISFAYGRMIEIQNLMTDKVNIQSQLYFDKKEEKMVDTSNQRMYNSPWIMDYSYDIKREPCNLSEIKIEKSREENAVNINTLIALASAEIRNENEKYGALPISIKEALEHKIAERTKKVAMDAADNIIALLTRHENAIQDNVNTLRDIRRKEKLIKDSLAKAERAKAYGMATNNWVPLYVAVTGLPTNADKALIEVPSDWVAPVAE